MSIPFVPIVTGCPSPSFATLPQLQNNIQANTSNKRTGRNTIERHQKKDVAIHLLLLPEYPQSANIKRTWPRCLEEQRERQRRRPLTLPFFAFFSLLFLLCVVSVQNNLLVQPCAKYFCYISFFSCHGAETQLSRSPLFFPLFLPPCFTCSHDARSKATIRQTNPGINRFTTPFAAYSINTTYPTTIFFSQRCRYETYIRMPEGIEG